MNQEPHLVLVIDSDAASLSYLTVMLRKNGYNVLTSDSGREGLISAWKNLPAIIIVDPDLPDIIGVDLITRLRQDRRTAQIPCIALGSLDDQEKIAGYLSHGFNDYVVKSNQALDKLLELMQRLLKQEEVVPKRGGLLIVFISAKGGTGVSSLCANVAMNLGKVDSQKRVVVVDLVLPIGSVAQIVGYDSCLNLVSIAAQPPEQITISYLNEQLPKLPQWNFALLAGSPDPESALQLRVNRIPEIIVALQQAYDYVFVDLGRSLSRISLPIIQRADVLALVLSTDHSTVHLTKTIWGYLKLQGVDAQHIYPILNRAVGLEGLTKAEVEQILGLDIRVTMPYMGSNFTIANNRHEPVTVRFPTDASALILLQAVNEIIELGRRLRPA